MSIKILVQPRPHMAHQEVLVDINWDGVSAEDMKFLAQQCLVHNLEARIKSGFYDGIGIPEVIEIQAAWHVHKDEGSDALSAAPESWRTGQDQGRKVQVTKMTAAEQAEQAFKGLSKEDQALLIAML